LSFVRGPYVPFPRFQVKYSGSGDWSTVYHSTPANPGANPDTNDAHDSSHQRWSLTFAGRLNPRRPGAFELEGTSGSARASGQIWHRHIDGIYAADNSSISCEVEMQTPVRAALPAAITVGHPANHPGLLVTALEPVSQVLALLPQQCPGQGDSLDGLADNYFTPGFSFASGYGPARWFRSQAVSIPLRVLQHAERMTIELHPGPGSAPPADCAVPDPSWQWCQTGGTWRGTLTLRRIG
jgi:hypothetical protein